MGEDGSNHQMIETVPFLRRMPKMLDSPGDSEETNDTYMLAIKNRKASTHSA